MGPHVRVSVCPCVCVCLTEQFAVSCLLRLHRIFLKIYALWPSAVLSCLCVNPYADIFFREWKHREARGWQGRGFAKGSPHWWACFGAELPTFRPIYPQGLRTKE